jgi:hypothetical protein
MEACAVNGNSSSCTCDMGVGAWALTTQRFGRVDFIAPFSPERFRMTTRTSAVREVSSNNIFFISAFSMSVWLAIVGLVTAHIFVTMMDKTFAPADDDISMTRLRSDASKVAVARHLVMKNPYVYRLRHAFYNTAMHFVGQDNETVAGHKRSTKSRAMNLLASLFRVSHHCVPGQRYCSSAGWKTGISVYID